MRGLIKTFCGFLLAFTSYAQGGYLFLSGKVIDKTTQNPCLTHT